MKNSYVLILKIPIYLFLLVSNVAYSQSVFSSIWSYFKQYQLGIERTYVTDRGNVAFTSDKYSEDPRASCRADPNKGPGYYRCSQSIIFNKSGDGGDWGLFLQPAFKRRGLFYWNLDLAFAARAYEGSLKKEERNFGLGLTTLSIHLYGVQVRPYLQLGITPKNWPDLIFSFGPVAQWLWGSCKVNDKHSSTGPTGIINWSSLNDYRAFNELEIVFLRYQEGALSLFYSHISGQNSLQSGKLFPKDLDGTSNYKVDFNREMAGLKILLNWP